MSKLHIVTDGAADMPRAWREEFEIHVVPVYIQFGERSYRQEAELSVDDFYRMASEPDNVPKTSQPTPNDFIEAYRQLAQPGDTILSIHVTAKLSGTFASAEIASREVAAEGITVIPFDSAAGSVGIGFMCREARQLARAGANAQAILKRLEFIRQHLEIVLTLNDFTFARKSGRVKALQAALASMLNVKPVFFLRDGVIDVGERIRTRRKALERLVEFLAEKFGNRKINMAIVHARDYPTAEQLFAQAKTSLNSQYAFITDLSISVAANLGPGTVGIVAYPVDEMTAA